MTKESVDGNEQKAATSSACAEGKRFTDGSLRRCLEEIDAETVGADMRASQYLQAGHLASPARYYGVANGLAKAKSILLKHLNVTCTAEHSLAEVKARLDRVGCDAIFGSIAANECNHQELKNAWDEMYLACVSVLGILDAMIENDET